METKAEKAILDEMLEPSLGTQLNLGSAFRAVNLAELISQYVLSHSIYSFSKTNANQNTSALAYQKPTLKTASTWINIWLV